MEPVLNQAKVDKLADEIGQENVPVLLDIFLGELSSYIEHLSDDGATDVLEYLKEISHALKSSAASFGADALCHLSTQIDTKAKTGAELDVEQSKHAMITLLHETKQSYHSLLVN